MKVAIAITSMIPVVTLHGRHEQIIRRQPRTFQPRRQSSHREKRSIEKDCTHSVSHSRTRHRAYMSMNLTIEYFDHDRRRYKNE